MGLGTDRDANHWLSPTDEWDVFTDRSVKNWAPHDPNIPTRGKLVWRTLESLKLFRKALEGDEVAQRELLVWPEDQQRAAAESYREGTVEKATKRLRSDPGLLKQMEHMVILSGLQTLSEAADAYYKVVDASARADVSKPKLKHRIKRCVEEIGDMSLTQLTHDELTAAVDGWVSKAKAGKISPITMTNQVRALRGFVDWLDASNRTSWTAPRRWERIFRLGNRSDVAKLKRERPVEPKSFNVEELQRLYQAADKTMRLWILLGLQVGMTQRDVAKLCPEQIDLENRTLWYRRSKTGCYARVPLWDETYALLKPYCRRSAKPEDPIFRTVKGHLVVHMSEGNKNIDAVGSAFRDLKKAAGIGPGGFTVMRATASQFHRNHAGKEIAEGFLAHRTTGVAKHYHEFSDWDAVAASVLAHREHVAKMFEPLPRESTGDGVDGHQ
jgi:integrase